VQGRKYVMKISGSNLSLISDSHSEEMGLMLEEQTRDRTTRQTQTRLRNIRGLPQMVVDRVSISQGSTMEYQSQYSFSVTGRSSVMTGETGETVSQDMKIAMERLVGGVMDKDVIIKNIREKKDIDLSKAKQASLPESSGNPKTPGGTRSVAAWELSVKQTNLYFEEESVNFQSSGEVTTEDGRIITFSLDMSLDRAFLSRTEEETLVRQWQERINLTDPLIISLDGKAPQLTDAVFEFDLNNDGKTENVSFASFGSGFLALDKNGDHIINNGSELFGPGTGNGFEELRAFDQDQNNWIDENDDVFTQLSVWTKDENGQDRLISMKDAGLGAISLQYAATGFDMTKGENELQGRLKNTGIFLYENGMAGSVQEMDLASQSRDKKETAKEKSSRPDMLFSTQSERPALAFTPMTAPVPAARPEEMQNPLKDLLDRIKKLKEEMARLYEHSGYTSARKTTNRSGYGYYEALNPEMPSFFYGRKI